MSTSVGIGGQQQSANRPRYHGAHTLMSEIAGILNVVTGIQSAVGAQTIASDPIPGRSGTPPKGNGMWAES